MNEQAIAEALGVSAEMQEAAAPAAEPTETGAPEAEVEAGANVQEVADPAEETDEEPTEELTEEPTKPAGKQDKDERRRQAAARRAQERKDEIARAVREAVEAEKAENTAALEKVIAGMGLTDTATGQPITTKEQYEKWKRDADAEKLRRELKTGQLTPEALAGVVAENPAIRAANEMLERQREFQRRQAAEAAREKMAGEVAEITKINPAIKELNDILAMPTGPKFLELAKRGVPLPEAYRYANMDTLAAQSAAAAKQAAMNAVGSKAHLEVTKTSGSGAVPVPADVMAQYRLLMPGKTDEEIQKHYQRYVKK
jgi:hypothetical protein